MTKVRGSVKWFSNKKGYGFITPAEGSPISEDIFVHQSSIHCEGYRTLDEGWEVEFEIGQDDDGKAKAIDVTAPGGGPCTGVRKNRRRRDGASKGGGGNRPSANRPQAAPKPKQKEPFWHDSLSEDVKKSMELKEIRTTTGTIDVAVGDARVKLGTQGYASMVHAGGIIAEGKFSCGADGIASFSWDRCISFDAGSGEWVATKDKAAELLASVSLSDANVLPVGAEETAETLWGKGKADPKATLEENGFLMRRVVLTPRRRR